MRRLLAGLLASLLAVLVLVVAPGAAAAEVTSGDVVVLAAAADDEAPAGPEPMDRADPNNPAPSLAGYEDPEVQFTWAASFLLLGLVLTLMIVGGALWYLLVIRPGKAATAH